MRKIRRIDVPNKSNTRTCFCERAIYNYIYAGIAMLYALARTVRGIYRLRVYEYSTKVAWMSDEVRDTGIDVLFSLASVLFVLFISQISNSGGISVHFFFLSCIISSNARIILLYGTGTIQYSARSFACATNQTAYSMQDTAIRVLVRYSAICARGDSCRNF